MGFKRFKKWSKYWKENKTIRENRAENEENNRAKKECRILTKRATTTTNNIYKNKLF